MSTVETVAKVLRHLELVRVLSVGAMAAELGQPKSTVSRLLKDMGRAGFLARDERTRRYAPGPLLLSAARHYKPSFQLIDRAAATLEPLVRRFGHSGFVMGLDRNTLIVLRAIAGAGRGRVQLQDSQIGGCAFDRSAGRALLARLTDAEVTVLHSAASRPSGLQHLLAALQAVRRQGYAESYGEAVPDVGGVAVAVGVAGEDAVALNIAFPVRLVAGDERRAIAQALLTAAQSWDNRAVRST